MCLPLLSFSTKLSTVKVKFYSATVDVQYDKDIIFKFRTCARDKCLKTFYEKMEKTNYQPLLDDLLNYKEILKLNDWFFYNLVRKSVEKVYAKKTEIYQTLVCWFLFTKAGYDTQLTTAVNQFLFLSVATNDKVYDTSYIRHEGKTYVNLTALYFRLNTRRALYDIPNYKPNIGGEIFCFDIDHLPNIPSRSFKKTVNFKYDKEDYSIEVEADTMARALMRNYPMIEYENYFWVPPSDGLKTSLLSQIAPYLEGKTEQEKVEFLVSFTRTAFNFKFDEELYKHNQPMIPEEVFIWEYSDHEDRSALFYFLITELTSLDMISVRYYGDYITIAVELPNPVGKPINYNGKNYFVCDPTLPNNSKEIGKFPIGLTYETMEIYNAYRSTNTVE